MAIEPASAWELEGVRSLLISEIQSRLTGTNASMLRGLGDGEPDFTLIDLPHAADLPAIRWKLINLARLKASNPSKFAEQRTALLDLLH